MLDIPTNVWWSILLAQSSRSSYLTYCLILIVPTPQFINRAYQKVKYLWNEDAGKHNNPNRHNEQNEVINLHNLKLLTII